MKPETTFTAKWLRNYLMEQVSSINPHEGAFQRGMLLAYENAAWALLQRGIVSDRWYQEVQDITKAWYDEMILDPT